MNEQAEHNTHSGCIEVEKEQEGILRLIMKSRLDAESIGGFWRKAEQLLEHSKPNFLIVDAHEVAYCDGVGVSLLLNLAQ